MTWSFAGTLDMGIHDVSHDASRGIGGGGGGGIVNSTEIFTKMFDDRRDYQASSLKSIGIASFSSPRDILSHGVILHVNGFIHATSAVLKTSLEAWFPIPGLDVAWTEIAGPFRNSDVVKNSWLRASSRKTCSCSSTS